MSLRQREEIMPRPSLKRLYKRDTQEMADIETASVIQVYIIYLFNLRLAHPLVIVEVVGSILSPYGVIAKKRNKLYDINSMFRGGHTLAKNRRFQTKNVQLKGWLFAMVVI